MNYSSGQYRLCPTFLVVIRSKIVICQMSKQTSKHSNNKNASERISKRALAISFPKFSPGGVKRYEFSPQHKIKSETKNKSDDNPLLLKLGWERVDAASPEFKYKFAHRDTGHSFWLGTDGFINASWQTNKRLFGRLNKPTTFLARGILKCGKGPDSDDEIKTILDYLRSLAA